MNLFIKVVNGQPVDHPYLADNLIGYHGLIPDGFEPFYRIQQPADLLKNPFQKAVCTYEKGFDGAVWIDKWTAVDMTEEEKQELIAKRLTNPPGPNMTLDTNLLEWNPNTPKPTDGQNYRWDTLSGAWIVVTP